MARTAYVVRYTSPGFPNGHLITAISRESAEDFRRAAYESGWSNISEVEEWAICPNCGNPISQEFADAPHLMCAFGSHVIASTKDPQP
jgi:hypothetical protein